MAHIRMSHVPHMNESRIEPTSHITQTNESCHTYEWVTSHKNESCRTCNKRVMSHIQKSHVTHTGWRRPIGCLKLQVIVHKRTTNYRALLRKMNYKDKASCDSTSPCTASLPPLPPSFGNWVNTSSHIYRLVSSYVPMSHDTRVNESCHTYEWVMSHMWMSHVTHMNESCHTYEWVMSHMWMRHMPHSYIIHNMNEWDVNEMWMRHMRHMGWLRLVGSLKL